MIRPLAMSNPVQFKGYTIMGPDDDENSIPGKENKNKKTGLTSNEKKIFLAGAFLGAMMGVGGTMIADKSQLNSLMRDMQGEYQMGEVDSLIVEDVTEDKIPDIILVGNNGISTIYDMSKDKVFYTDGNEKIEKIR